MRLKTPRSASRASAGISGGVKNLKKGFVFFARSPHSELSMRCRFGMVKTMEDLAYIGFPAALPALEEKSNGARFGMPPEPLLGAVLRVLAASKPGGRILELGTGTGIATT